MNKEARKEPGKRQSRRKGLKGYEIKKEQWEYLSG
jgi:hypothetical protein